jgi:hypothetical protein
MVGAWAPWRKVSSANATRRPRSISATCSRGSCRVKAKSGGPKGPPCRTPLPDLSTSSECWMSRRLCWPYTHAAMGSRAGQRCATAANMQSHRTVLNAFCQSICTVMPPGSYVYSIQVRVVFRRIFRTFLENADGYIQIYRYKTIIIYLLDIRLHLDIRLYAYSVYLRKSGVCDDMSAEHTFAWHTTYAVFHSWRTGRH